MNNYSPVVFFKAILLSVFSLFIMFGASVDASPKRSLYRQDGENVKVNADSIWKFRVAPWKCMLINNEGDTVTRYYDRAGVEKARKNSSDTYFCAMNYGPDNRDYYESLVRRKSGKLEWVRTWYLYGADYVKSSGRDRRDYEYTPRYCDRHGNWLYAYDWLRDKSYERIIIYYDEDGFSAEEDKAIDARIETLVSTIKEAENPLNPKNIATGMFSIGAKVLFIFGVFVLFMVVFRRRKFYFWFDKKATYHITPDGNKIFCLSMLNGFIPVALILAPTGMYLLGGHTTAVIGKELIISTFGGVVAAAVYSLLFILIRGHRRSYRCACWELLFGITMCLCLWATVLFSLIVAFFTLIALLVYELFFGKRDYSSSADDGEGYAGHKYVTSWDGESQALSHMGGGYYMDTDGAIYGGGGTYRLGDNKPFF